MSLLDLVPARYRLAGTLLGGALVLLALWAWCERRQAASDAAGYARGHAEYVQLHDEMATKAADGERDARAEERRRTAAQKESADEVQRIAALDRAARGAAAGRAAAAGQRLQHDIATIAASGGAVPGDSAAAGQCAASLATFAGVLGACRRVVQQLGRDADEEVADARGRGLECAARYDALTARAPP